MLSGLLLSLLFVASCENDGDKIYLSDIKDSEIVASKDKVVLSQEVAKQVVLSLVWNKNTLNVSNPNMSAPDILSCYIQVSTQEDFSSNVDESLETNQSKAYLGSELNAIAKNLGIEPGKGTLLYFRLKSVTGNNISPVYSNVAVVNVTSYLIDMSIGHILDKNRGDTGFTLLSPDMDGVYNGFMGALEWGNFFLQESDGRIWGNDAVSGIPYQLSSDEGNWNCWFPKKNGCFYVIVDTKKKVWSSLWIESLKVSGGIEAEMTFDRQAVKWTTIINANAAEIFNIKLNATGKQYDYSTGTDDSKATDASLAFVQSGNSLVLGLQAQDILISIPQAGQYTLVIDFSNPKEWTYKLESGGIVPQPVIQQLYLIGVDDGFTGGSWNFEHSIPLFNEAEKKYAGVIDINSKWGYKIGIEKDNWNNVYTMVNGGTAYAGSLEFSGKNNIVAPTEGLYLVETSLLDLKYNLNAIGKEVYALGLDEKWEFNMPLTAIAKAGVYTGSITFTKTSKDGFRIFLKNGDWNLWYGGTNGKLHYNGDNMKEDITLTPGTYTMTVDLINATYSIN